MRRHLRTELQQTKPFASLEEEVYLEILQTSQVAGRWVLEALKPSGLTPPQFNVLRILRGADPESLSSSRIAERMVNYDPDLTRLLDRLESNGLIAKARDERDRRVVNVRITREGLRVVGTASDALRARLETEMRAVSRRDLNALADLLEKVRGYAE
jgi:DNA-binding MarR family transcriptional regulator